jgi:hypothetical protein
MRIESASARLLRAHLASQFRRNICKLSQGARRNSKHFSDLRVAFSRRQRHFVLSWGFRTMPIGVPGMPITGSGMMAIMIPG